MHDYSTNEHVVGTWIDGRNVYEKTIYFGNLPNNDKKNVAHGIVNLDKVISFSGFAYYSSYILSIPKTAIESSSWGIDIFIENADSITIQTGQNRSSFVAYVTIQYTKTTDIAQS